MGGRKLNVKEGRGKVLDKNNKPYKKFLGLCGVFYIYTYWFVLLVRLG